MINKEIEELNKVEEVIEENNVALENIDLEFEKKKQELEDAELQVKKKMEFIKWREEKLNTKERHLSQEEIELERRIEELRLDKIKIQEECDKNAEYIIEDIKKRNIELNKKLGELTRVQLENTTIKEELLIRESEIASLKSENHDNNMKLKIYEENNNIEELLSVKAKLDRFSALEEENEVLKKELYILKSSNNKLSSINEEIEVLNDMNEILSNRLQRRESEIHYLKKIEKAKGTGEDGSQQIFQEIIDKQIQKDKDTTPEQYKDDEKFVDGFVSFCKEAGFIYDKSLVRAFIASLRSSKLTILKGYSGTGKTSLPNLFSKYLNAECVVVPVQPNWRTKQDIMGFYNYFTNKFIPTELTQTLLRANVSSNRIFLIVLDEMNLARVEYYFSEFNSKIWLDKDERKIELFEGITNYGEEVQRYVKDNKINIPDNVYFIGTINEDDSVSPISDKIFDRAQVIEFMQLPTSKSVGNLDKASEGIDKSKYTTVKSFNRDLDKSREVAIDLVDKVNEITKEKFNKVIGFRSLMQIKEFVKCFMLAGGSEKEALDIQLVSKFVPKFKSVSSENDISSLMELIDQIGELFEKKFNCSKDDIKNLQIINQLEAVIEALGE